MNPHARQGTASPLPASPRQAPPAISRPALWITILWAISLAAFSHLWATTWPPSVRLKAGNTHPAIDLMGGWPPPSGSRAVPPFPCARSCTRQRRAHLRRKPLRVATWPPSATLPSRWTAPSRWP